MGLPTIDIIFKGKAASAIRRSSQGIVALLLRDQTVDDDTPTIIKSIEDIVDTDWTPENVVYIKQTLLGTPSKIYIIRMKNDAADEQVSVGLAKVNNVKFNYLAMPSATALEAQDIASWVQTKRMNKRLIKAVVANQPADSMGVINFTTEEIAVGSDVYTAQQYTARIAGAVAGLSFDRSFTYYEFPEITSIRESDTPNEDIDAGQLIIFNDGEAFKIGRGVNSLVTVTASMKASYKKILVVEVMDMIHDDIRDTFAKEYVAKYKNLTDNQILFLTAVNAYFKGLTNEEILDNRFISRAWLNADAQRLAWESTGIDTSSWTDAQVLDNPFEDNVYLAGQIKIADAMEDLAFEIETV